MKHRYRIGKVERRENGVPVRLHTIRYWWPARRGEKRRSKVDPETFLDKRNATERAIKMLRAIEDHECGRGPDPFADVPQDINALVEKFLELMALGTFNRKKGKRPSNDRVPRVRRQLGLMRERFGLRDVRDFLRFADEATEQFSLLQQDMHAEATGKLRGWGDKTHDEHVATLRQFCGWLVAKGVLTSDPTANVPMRYGDHSVTFFRRALPPAEIDALLRAAEASGSDGFLRATLWAFAIYTGFRLSEIAATNWADVVLDDAPRVELDGGRTKNGKHATQFVPGWLADRLKQLGSFAQPSASVFPEFDWHNVNDLLRADAVEAGLGQVERKTGRTSAGELTSWLVWKDPRGAKHRFDFHSMRHTFATLVGRTAQSPKDSQDIARHADERTNRRYWHGDRERHRDVINALPVPKSVCTACARAAHSGAASDTCRHHRSDERIEGTA